MVRYEITAEFDALVNCCQLVTTPDDDGMWCKADEALAAIADSQKRNADLARQVTLLQSHVAHLERLLAFNMVMAEREATDYTAPTN